MNRTLARTLIRLLTAVLLKMQIAGYIYCVQQPCKRELSRSTASVYTTGNEVNYCLNTTVRLPQVTRHGVQVDEHKWPITRHHAIAEQKEEEEPPSHAQTHTLPPPPTPLFWIWKGKQTEGWVEVGYVVVFLFMRTLMFSRALETFCSRPRWDDRLQAGGHDSRD